MPRMMFGVLNTLLYFPSGAVYPQQGFPLWMKPLALADPFTYAVHAFKEPVLKNTGFGAYRFRSAVFDDSFHRRDVRRDDAVSAGRCDVAPKIMKPTSEC